MTGPQLGSGAFRGRRYGIETLESPAGDQNSGERDGLLWAGRVRDELRCSCDPGSATGEVIPTG